MNVLVTGASRGIGLGFVNHYLAEGADVWACYRSARGGLARLKDPRLHALRWDVSVDAGEGVVCETELPERIDLLINNAGVYGPDETDAQSLQGVTMEVMHAVFNTNCLGALRVVQRLWRRVASARGVIANISSKMGSAGDNTSGGCYAYRASKAALVTVSKSMAVDLAPKHVRVITLHPGWVRTDMTDHSGLIDVDSSVSGMARVLKDVDAYAPGAFVAFDGAIVPY